MLSPEALRQLLLHVSRRAAAKASERIPGYDLDKVLSHLDLMDKEDLAGWKQGEITATIESRTASGCPDRHDPEQTDIIQDCYTEAVQEITTERRTP